MGIMADKVIALKPGTKFVSSLDVEGQPNLGEEFYVERTENGYKFGGTMNEAIKDQEFPERLIPIIFEDTFFGQPWEIVEV